MPELVTIGIPTFNRSHFVLDALQSCLNQTYSNLDIVVADNASVDDTWEKLNGIKDPRVRLIRQTSNVGGARNFNTCVREAKGDLFLLLCDDDLLEPTAIEKLSKPLREGFNGIPAASIGLAWSNYLNVNQDRKPLWKSRSGPAIEPSVAFIEGLLNGFRGPMLSAVLTRTADVRKFGGYDGERHAMLSDTGNWGRVALSYPHVVCVPEPLMRYTVHEETATNKEGTARDWQARGEVLHADLLEVLRGRGELKGVKRLAKTKKNMLANLTVSVLMRSKGQPGWIGIFAKEFWRCRRFMFTPLVAKRIVRDGWKLLRID